MLKTKLKSFKQPGSPWGISWLLVASLNATPLSHYGARLSEERKRSSKGPSLGNFLATGGFFECNTLITLRC